jgi:hypothetical protein
MSVKSHHWTAIALLLLSSWTQAAENPTEKAATEIGTLKVGKSDWPQWGGWSGKNNTPEGKNIPTEWDIDAGENVLWSAPLGSQTYGNAVIANGKVYVGTNNYNAYVPRFPNSIAALQHQTPDRACS